MPTAVTTSPALRIHPERSRSSFSLCRQYYHDIFSVREYRANALLYVGTFVGEALVAGGIRLASSALLGDLSAWKNVAFKSVEQCVYVGAGIHAASYRAQDTPPPKRELIERLHVAARNECLMAGLFIGSIIFVGYGGGCVLGASALLVRAIQSGRRYHRNGVWSASREYFYPSMKKSPLGPIAGALEQGIGMALNVIITESIATGGIVPVAICASVLIGLGASIGFLTHRLMAKKLVETKNDREP